MNADHRSALHEAGHAVVAVLNGVPFAYVSLKVKTEVLSDRQRSWTEGVVYSPADEAARQALLRAGKISDAELQISLAGGLAETLYLGRPDEGVRLGAAEDLHTLSVAVGSRLGCSPAEAAQRPEWRALLGRAIIPCLEALNSHWWAVDRVGTLLLQRRRLSGEAVRDIVGEFQRLKAATEVAADRV